METICLPPCIITSIGQNDVLFDDNVLKWLIQMENRPLLFLFGFINIYCQVTRSFSTICESRRCALTQCSHLFVFISYGSIHFFHENSSYLISSFRFTVKARKIFRLLPQVVSRQIDSIYSMVKNGFANHLITQSSQCLHIGGMQMDSLHSIFLIVATPSTTLCTAALQCTITVLTGILMSLSSCTLRSTAVTFIIIMNF